LHENSPNRFVGFRPLKLNRDKGLILVGWSAEGGETQRFRWTQPNLPKTGPFVQPLNKENEAPS